MNAKYLWAGLSGQPSEELGYELQVLNFYAVS